MDITTLTEAYNAAVDDVEKFSTEWDSLADDADADAVATAKQNLDDALARADETKDRLDTATQLADAKSKFQKVALPAGDDKPPAAAVTVTEPDMYTKEKNSFLQDLYAFQLKGDPIAAERIAKHQAYEVERYAVATSTLGGIIPPQYLVDLYAKAQRFGRVFADQCRHEDLPEQGMSLIVPRLTQGLSAGIQASEGAAASTQDPVETDLTVPVRTIAGYSPVSRQTLERAAYSEAILFEDLVARYNATLDTQCLNGSGSSGQHTGVINQSGVSTATISSWSAANAWAALAGETGVIAAINSWAATVGAVADKIVMHPRRWGAFLGLLDSNNRPLFGIGGFDNYAAMGGGEAPAYGRVGAMLGCEVYTDANIPTNLGTGTNQDDIIVMASQAVILWERPDDPVTLAFEQQAGTSLQVQLIAYGYSAFTAGRYPAAAGVVSGTGLT